eukprot:g29722.t1
MHVGWLLCLAMILTPGCRVLRVFLNAILDGFLVLALGLRTQWDFFFQKQPWYMFLGRLLTFVGPILEMLGAYLSWSVYKEPGDSVRLRGDRDLLPGPYGASPEQ